MGDELGKRLIGQKEATRVVFDAIRRPRTDLPSPSRPTDSFLLLDLMGVDKTELTEAFTEFLFDDGRAVTHIDMPEYSEEHSMACLVGTSPEYAGYG